jgi:hypothetical protein
MFQQATTSLPPPLLFFSPQSRSATACSAPLSYRCTTGQPDPPVARSGRIGPARYGPLRATGHTGRTTYRLGPRLRPMARPRVILSAHGSLGPHLTGHGPVRPISKQIPDQFDKINLTRSNMMMKTWQGKHRWQKFWSNWAVCAMLPY